MDIARSIEAAFTSLFNGLPTILGALIVLLIFWIISGILGKLVTTVLQKLKVDSLPGQIGLNPYLAQAGITITMSRAIGNFVKWFIRILGLTAFCNALGLVSVSAFLNQILAYLPNVLVALIIFLIGSLIAQFAGRLATGFANGAKIAWASLIGNLVRYAILFFVGLIVLDQLGIGSSIVFGLWAAVTGGLSLALAIAVGLGGREVTQSYLNSRALALDLKPGMLVSLPDGTSGQISSVGALYTTFTTRDGQIKIPNRQITLQSIKLLGESEPNKAPSVVAG
jgi:hypothetical protein